MKIIVGSKNPTKLNAVRNIFPEEEIIGLDVESHVSAQPFSDQETLQGAINRAKQCASTEVDAFGIGLEGGVMYVGEDLYLCNWGALVTPDGKTYTSSGARVLLPKEIEKKLKEGIELGEIMDAYANKSGVSKKEGAIGIFTNNLLSRSEMFAQVVLLLKGQWEYWKMHA